MCIYAPKRTLSGISLSSRCDSLNPPTSNNAQGCLCGYVFCCWASLFEQGSSRTKIPPAGYRNGSPPLLNSNHYQQMLDYSWCYIGLPDATPCETTNTTTHPAARFCLGWLVPLHRFPFASLWERDWRNMARDIHLMVVTAGPTPFPETNSFPRTPPKIQKQQGTSKLI